MMRTQDLDQKDFKYIVHQPDASFSPKRNQAVIEETIREATAFHKKNNVAIESALGERIDAVSAYGCYRFNRGFKGVKEYLGTKLYTQLVGEQLLEKVRVMKTLNRLNGNKGKFEKSILL